MSSYIERGDSENRHGLGGRPRSLPDDERLRELLTQGVTHKEIALRYGVTRQAVVAAVRRAVRAGADAAGRRYERYDDLIPWKVSTEHSMRYPARMLRMEARRRRGLPNPESGERKLESWKTHLADANAVVLYDADTEEGFWYVERKESDKDLIREPEGRDS